MRPHYTSSVRQVVPPNIILICFSTFCWQDLKVDVEHPEDVKADVVRRGEVGIAKTDRSNRNSSKSYLTSGDHLLVQDSSRLSIDISRILSRETPVVIICVTFKQVSPQSVVLSSETVPVLRRFASDLSAMSKAKRS